MLWNICALCSSDIYLHCDMVNSCDLTKIRTMKVDSETIISFQKEVYDDACRIFMKNRRIVGIIQAKETRTCLNLNTSIILQNSEKILTTGLWYEPGWSIWPRTALNEWSWVLQMPWRCLGGTLKTPWRLSTFYFFKSQSSSLDLNKKIVFNQLRKPTYYSIRTNNNYSPKSISFYHVT